MFGKHKNYPTRASLKPVRDVLKEASELFVETFSERRQFSVPPAAGGLVGAVTGVGVTKATLVAGAVAGTKGAALLTSGLAFMGAAVGGGMAVGIGVAAAPAVALGAAGYGVLRHQQQKRLRLEKEELLQEARRRREEMSSAIVAGFGDDQLRGDLARNISVRLGDMIRHLEDDLGRSPSVP